MATIDQIIAQLQAAGHPSLPEGHPIADGKPHRYGRQKKYWYSLHEIVRAGVVAGYAGAFGYWSGDDNGAQTFEWQGAPLSADDLAATRNRQRAAEEQEAERRRRAAKMAANRAYDQWNSASKSGTSAYLERKQITPESVRFDAEGTTLVPMYRYDGDGPRLVGLQKISPDGAKRFNKGMEKKGAELQLGVIEPDDKIALLGEGYATMRSIRMALDDKIPASVCFDAGGILAAAASIREAFPGLHLLICADDDWKVVQRLRDHLADEYGFKGELELGGEPVEIVARGQTLSVQARTAQINGGPEFAELRVLSDGGAERIKRFENTGRERAIAAALAVGNASVVFPVFSNRGDRKLTDFNDLHCEEGLHVVKAQIETAILAALAPPNDAFAPVPETLAGSPSQDPLYDQAAQLVRKERRVSISLVQRHLRIGYNRAAAIVEDLERGGVVSAASGSGSRKVLRAALVEAPTSADADTPEWDGREAESGAHDWMVLLRRAEKSHALLPCLDNVFAILMNDSRWAGVFGFEQFSLRVMKLKAPPFEGGETGEWSDRDDARCVLWLGQNYMFSPRSDVVMDAVFLAADRNRYHEVRDYLSSLQWDRAERLKTWLVDYLGVPDTPYARLVGTKWLLGAIGRVMQPGCKMDNVLILEGAQDAGKSATFRTLFHAKWFTDANITIGDKDAFAVMAGKWVIELAELDALSKTDSSNAKRFFTTAVDTYRPPYAKRAIDVPRQSVFAGTVNFDTYLKDESGNRRYWPVKVAALLDLKRLAADRDQIWAEAYSAYLEWDRANREADNTLPTPWQVLPAEKHLFSTEQEARYEGDIYETMIARHVTVLSRVTMEQILADCLKLEIAKWTPAEQRRVGKAMKSLGWIRKRESTGARDWYYTPPEEIDEPSPTPVAEFVADGVDDDAPL